MARELMKFDKRLFDSKSLKVKVSNRDQWLIACRMLISMGYKEDALGYDYSYPNVCLGECNRLTQTLRDIDYISYVNFVKKSKILQKLLKGGS